MLSLLSKPKFHHDVRNVFCFMMLLIGATVVDVKIKIHRDVLCFLLLIVALLWRYLCFWRGGVPRCTVVVGIPCGVGVVGRQQYAEITLHVAAAGGLALRNSTVGCRVVLDFDFPRRGGTVLTPYLPPIVCL